MIIVIIIQMDNNIVDNTWNSILEIGHIIVNNNNNNITNTNIINSINN